MDSSEWIFRIYKLHTLLWINTIIDHFFNWAHITTLFYLTFLIIGSHIVFMSILGQLNWSLLPNICANLLGRLILQCSSLSIILTSSYKGRWLLFSLYIWSVILDFSISPRTTAFRCSSSLIFVSGMSRLCIIFRWFFFTSSSFSRMYVWWQVE